MMFFRIWGILGLIFISIGVLLKKRNLQDIYFMIGGIFLTVYSIHIRDLIFIILQLVFFASALFDYFKNKS